MCGIVGAVVSNCLSMAQKNGFFSAMASMEDRGPDSDGWYSFRTDQTGILNTSNYSSKEGFFRSSYKDMVVLGHKRLSIIDLTNAGHQPMTIEGSDVWITYNGEVYNYIELRQELKKLGRTFHTSSDTEVVLLSYLEWGKDCFSKFNGMWGMAILDCQKKQLLLSRDRFGIKPLYYLNSKEGFFFGSNIRSVLHVSGCQRKARPDIVRDFLLYSLQPTEDDTFFDGVYQVEKGSCIQLNLNSHTPSVSKWAWWNISPTAINGSNPVELWQSTFEKAVNIRMRSDVPIGSCLSGGIDSSAIVAFMNKINSDQEIHTFTSCYQDPRWDERSYVEMMLERIYGCPHWIYPEKLSLMDDLNHLHLIQEQPITTLSVYNQFCVMRGAHQAGIKVLLDGQGADEIFMGYDSCQTIYLASLLRRGNFSGFITHIRALSKNRISMGLRQSIVMLTYLAIPYVRKKINERKLEGVINSDLLHAKGNGTFGKIKNTLHDLPLSRKGWLEINPLPSLLHYEDRNSMAFSIETRLPFLDYNMVNLAFGLPVETMLEGGWPKLVCRKAIEQLVPPEIVWRQDKMGFPAPTAQFMKDHCDKLSMLFDSSCRGRVFYNPAKVSTLLRHNPPAWLWKIISIELWLQVMEVQAG